MAAKTIEDRVVIVGVGSRVENAAGRVEQLMPCDWDGAAFRFPHSVADFPALAINIEITGRKFLYRGGRYRVKVRIEWVGDGEPSTFSTGWLLGSPWDFPRVPCPVDEVA